MKLWKPQPNDTHKHWVEAILAEALDKLNDWETNFMEDISTIVLNGRTLTESQEKKLEQLYAKHTA